MSQEDPSEDTPPPTPKSKKFSRRELFRIFGLTAILAEVHTSAVVNSQTALDEQGAVRMGRPVLALMPTSQNLVSTVRRLKSQGYNLFCIGDESHNSFAAPRAAIDLLKANDLAINDVFVETPQEHKGDPHTLELLGHVSYQQAENPGAKERNKSFHVMNDEELKNQRVIRRHATDSFIGPDHQDFMLFDFERYEDGLQHNIAELKFTADPQRYIDAEHNDIVFRNKNMCAAIARVFIDHQAQGIKTCGLFQAGVAHMRGNESVPALLQKVKIPGLKIAIIEVLPMLEKSMEGKVWQCKSDPDRVVLTIHDAINGKELYEGNILPSVEGTMYQFPRMRQQQASSSLGK